MNCAALPETLLESELFGHEKGAFTGATASRRGRIELADGGTFFLDEIGEMQPELQAKLLRVLQERRFERVGGARTIEADVRWVAATNRDPSRTAGVGRAPRGPVPPAGGVPHPSAAAARAPRDILPLADTLLARIGGAAGPGPSGARRRCEARIIAAPWPGNVRELANALERAAILAGGSVIRGGDLESPNGTGAAKPVHGAGAGPDEPRALATIERDAIDDALAATGGNRREAAERLGIGLRTLYDKLKRYRLEG